MGKKADMSGVEPVTRPSRRKIGKTEDPAESPESPESPALQQEAPESPEAPKAQAGAKYNPKALVNKTPGQRHPVTATIPVYKLSALDMLAATITVDQEINPTTAKVTRGCIASMLTELGIDLCSGNEEARATFLSITQAEDPKKVLGAYAVVYKLAQSKSKGSAEGDDEDLDQTS